jgi:hypothetical protein
MNKIKVEQSTFFWLKTELDVEVWRHLKRVGIYTFYGIICSIDSVKSVNTVSRV